MLIDLTEDECAMIQTALLHVQISVDLDKENQQLLDTAFEKIKQAIRKEAA